MRCALFVLLFLGHCRFFYSDRADRTPFVKGNFYISKGSYSEWREEGYDHEKNIYDVVYPFIKEMERLGKARDYLTLVNLRCNEDFDFREKGGLKKITADDPRFKKLREAETMEGYRKFEKNERSHPRYPVVYIQNSYFFEESFYSEFFNYSIVMYNEDDPKKKTYEIKLFNAEPAKDNREILRRFTYKLKYDNGNGPLCAMYAYYDRVGDPEGYEVYEPERKIKSH